MSELGGFSMSDVDLVIGGPPCQGFSYAGDRNVDDPRNRMVYTFLDYVEAFRPKYFLIENVLGILTMGKEEGDEVGPFVRYMLDRSRELGYHFAYEKHNMKSFGVPQNRKRVIFAGTRIDILERGQAYKFPEPTHTWDYFDELAKRGNTLFSEFPDKEPYVTVFEAIGHLPEVPAGVQDIKEKDYPFGSPMRIGPAEYTTFEGKYFFEDKFNKLLVPTGRIVGQSYLEHNKDGHYRICDGCGHYNLVVRKKCHYCGETCN